MVTKKKTAVKRASDKHRKTQELHELLQKAQGELTGLLILERGGRLTNRKLETGLKEIQHDVKRMLAFKKAFL